MADMSDTYFRITEKKKSCCFSSGMVQNIPGMARVLSEARDMQRDHERLDVNVMVRLGAWQPISENTWTTMMKQSQDGQNRNAFADINVDQGRAVLSDWLISNGNGRAEVTGKLDALVQCYKTSMVNGKLDQERFAIDLYDLCSVETYSQATEQEQTADDGMQMGGMNL